MKASLISNRARPRAVPAALAALLLPPGVAFTQDDDDPPSLALSEVPSFGASRPGPVRPSTPATPPPEDEAEAEPTAEPEVVGVAPVQLQIENAAVDSAIEQGKIEDGVMMDPSGPFIVTWYEQLSAIGEGTNVVLAGHLDYFDVPQGVFYYVPGLVAGDIVRVIDETGETWEYEIEWNETFNVLEQLTPEFIQTEVVGDTGEEALTMITCGGTFDPSTMEYIERRVIRARLV